MQNKRLFLSLVIICHLPLHSWVYAAEKHNNVTHISQHEFVALSEKENTVIIDVRTPREFTSGHIAQAVNIPHFNILEDISLLDPYLGKDIIFYCHTGVRVRRVTNYLRAIGYLEQENIFHLKGDIRAWQARGLPLVK